MADTPTNVPNLYQITCNTFDPLTGQVNGQSTTTFTPDQIQSQIADLQAQIDSLNALLADLPTPAPAV